MNNRKDIIVFIGILLVAFLARGLFLSYISQVVFDEVHFGKFISSYCCTHQRFFDIHPPIGKLLIATGAYMSGYNGLFPFEYIGQPFVNVPIAGIRMVPAMFGTILAGVIYILLRLMNVSRIFSMLGGLAIALDNALIVESRFILMDNILLVATFGAITSAIATIRANSRIASWIFVIITGILAGASMGIKFTGLIAGGLVVILWGVEMARSFLPLTKGEKEGVSRQRLTSPNPSFVRRGILLSWLLKIVVMALCAIAVYLSAWAIHFSILTQPGSGDVWGVPTGNFTQDILSVHQQMISANYNLTAGHPYGSKWWTWPFMIRPVFYWQGTSGNQFVYLLGNPAVWWGSFIFFCIAMLAIIVQFIRTRKITIKNTGYAWLMIVGYLWAYVPLMRVPRVLFLYHYLTPLIFSIIIVIWWVDKHIVRKKEFVITACVIILLGFLYISPLTYGYPIPPFWQTMLFSISSWR